MRNEFTKEFITEEAVTEFMNSDIVNKGYYFGIPKKYITVDGKKVTVVFERMTKYTRVRMEQLGYLGFSRIEA